MSGSVTSFCEAFDEMISVIKKDELQEYQEIVDFFNRVSTLYGIQAWEIFDEYDSPPNIEKFIDAAHEELKIFLLFHIDRCRSF